ncbi:peptidoglycan DD-metalloendopeptidase family protein [Aneurinibacillus sp. BA2021]|nr:peptidoglycan DD-metalloendopeptidase family protein [Aneurinibacillus sp. BA2021]
MFIERLSSWTKNKWSHGIHFVKDKKNRGKVACGILIGSLLASGTAAGGYIYESNVGTLYHVSVDGQDIGAVAQPQKVQKWMNEQLAAAKKKHPELELDFNKRISITGERHYNAQGTAPDEVIKKLASTVRVEASVAQLTVNGRPVAYAKDHHTVQQALSQLKALYNEKKPTQNLTAGMGAAAAVPALPAKPDMSNVSFKEKVEINTTTVNPAHVLDGAQLMNVLQKGVPELKKHTVAEGENLWNIGPKYGLTWKDLLAMNPGLTEDTLLHIGDTINVQAKKPKITVISKQEVAETVAVPYPIQAKPDPTKYRGDDKVIAEGKNGSKQVVYELVKENGKLVQKQAVQQKILQQPIAKIMIRGTKIKPSRGDGMFHMPATGTFSSPFGERWGRMHAGIDIATPIGTPVHTSDHGRVVFVGTKSGYGKCMIVDHGNGYRTLYGHLDEFEAQEGDIVVKGEEIAKSGNTGRSTGPHLHFEIHKGGEPVNPMPYLRS